MNRAGLYLLIFLNFSVNQYCRAQIQISVTLDRGRDMGQSFGSLFELTSEETGLVIGAGFQNGYNTYMRADRHSVDFFVRPRDSRRTLEIQQLPRPTPLCGTYLQSRDGQLFSMEGGVNRWKPGENRWEADLKLQGETIRVGHRLLSFADGMVSVDGTVVLDRPESGSYQRFFYANGYLCFYHVNRGEGGYRPYKEDRDGFSKLYACQWQPGEGKPDLAKAVVLRLPVVGETTFAWGQLGRQNLTCSNIGGFYVLENGRWKTLRQPDTSVSYQIYSTLEYYDRLLMGQYPTGRIFSYDGSSITEIENWPPVPPGVSGSAREAQTTAIYGGELFVGLWPWGELWRYERESRKWFLDRRMFDHPAISDQIIHPYDKESRGAEVPNRWGQRVTSLIPLGADLFVSTSAKDPCVWDAGKYPFLASGQWKSYGAVYRLSMPGHLSSNVRWTDGPTKLDFYLSRDRMRIIQDGEEIGNVALSRELAERVVKMKKPAQVSWGQGIFGQFGGRQINGEIRE